MEALKQWLIPYLISNIVFGLTIIGAIKKPMWTRIFLAGFFLWASYFNSTHAILSPQIYLIYATLDALPFYSDFINGFFSHYITPFVFTIAVGQFLIFFGLLLNKTWVKLSCIGGIIFGLAIVPLGVGFDFFLSAMPLQRFVHSRGHCGIYVLFASVGVVANRNH